MKIVPVDNPRPEQVVFCCVGGHRTPALTAVADLDGKPFEAYYCPEHRPDIVKVEGSE